MPHLSRKLTKLQLSWDFVSDRTFDIQDKKKVLGQVISGISSLLELDEFHREAKSALGGVELDEDCNLIKILKRPLDV